MSKPRHIEIYDSHEGMSHDDAHFAACKEIARLEARLAEAEALLRETLPILVEVFLAAGEKGESDA